MPTLDWLNRAAAFQSAARVPYRLLESVSSHGDGDARNLLIQGDNLEALKALLPLQRGQVKCIFIDPPYNTKSAFEHYDDNLEHAQWLSMMLPRLQLLRELLRDDGSIWVTIDDNEGHYLKVLMDEVFGRGNFVANVVWQKIFSPKNTARHLSEDHDHVLVFAKDGDKWHPNEMPRSDKLNASYKNPDSDPRGPWTSGDLSARNFYGAGTYPIDCPSGRVVAGPPNGMFWRVSKEKFAEMNADNRIWWGADGNNTPRIKRFLSEVKQGVVPQTLWMNTEVGNTQEAKKEVVLLFGSENFMTPKPERLLHRILHIATNPNDLVLDSFLGSGTTAAVAHKMGRRWIGIEMGEHAATHCLPRLVKVIEGEAGGISASVGWQGGGGFCFLRLGAPIFDEAGCIHPDVRFESLAAFVWQQETGGAFDPARARAGTPLLGVHYYKNESEQRSSDGRLDAVLSEETDREPVLEAAPLLPPPARAVACYLLFNGILGDKRPQGGNVLTREVLAALLALHAEAAPVGTKLIVYGEATRVGPERLAATGVTFRQIPYDIGVR